MGIVWQPKREPSSIIKQEKDSNHSGSGVTGSVTRQLNQPSMQGSPGCVVGTLESPSRLVKVLPNPRLILGQDTGSITEPMTLRSYCFTAATRALKKATSH